jgi:hypothetical protein
VSFPFDLHSTAAFDSHMPCRTRATPRPWLSESDFSRPQHARHGHGTCELASAVQRRHVGNLPAFCFFRLPRGVPRSLSSEHTNRLNCRTSNSNISGYHAEFHEVCYQNHTNPLNCRTSSSDISGHHADFHEGHGTVGEWQGRGMACVK